jgi:hypothetical protein
MHAMIEDSIVPVVPVQTTGEETETSASVTAENEKMARQWFKLACERLQNVNRWDQYCGFLSSTFELTDENECVLAGTAVTGQYIRIDIPGPGTMAGNGYDWVKIEKIEHIESGDHEEVFVLQARPAARPSHPELGIAHFLDNRATSSFVIKRADTELTATVFGRNEVPNSNSRAAVDKIRNTIVGSSGAIGVSKLQWKALVRGLLDF